MVTQDLSRDFLLEKFREMATNVQAIVSHINNIQEVFSYAVGITTAQNGKTLAAAGFSENELKALELLCAQNGLEFLRPTFIERLNDIHTGLTPANWGIAETGTLVIDSVSEDLRIVTMLSESHVVCVSMSNIKADSMDMEKILDQ